MPTLHELSRLTAAGLVIAALIFGLNPASAQSKTETLTISMVTSSAEADVEASKHAQQGAQLAVDLLNEAGGVVGPASASGTRRDTIYRFALKQRAAATQTEMRTVIQASIDDKPVAIIGPNAVALADNNLDLATSARIPQFVSLNDDPTGTIGSFIFRMRANDEALARDLASYLVTHRYYRSIATAADNSTRGRESVAAFDRAARAAGLAPAAAVTYDSAAADLTAPAQTLYDADPEVVVIFSGAQTAANLARGLRSRGYTGLIAYGALEGNAVAFVSRAGDAAVGVVGALTWTPDAIDAGSARFVTDYQARYGELPDSNAAIAFDTVAAIAAAVKLVGPGAQDIRNTIVSTPVIGGVQGIYRPAMLTGGRAIEASIIVALEADGKAAEQARFNSGLCIRQCADTFWPNANRSAATPTALRTVTLGFIGPLTGPDGEIGRRALQGAQLAVNEINTAGGIVGPQNIRYTIDLRSYSETASDQTAGAIRAALGLQPSALLGPTLTGHLLPNLGLAPSARVPQFVTGTAAVLTKTDTTRFVLQLRPADPVWASALAGYLVDTRGYTRLAVSAATTSYGQDSIAAFNAVVERFTGSSGARIVASTSHPVTATDLSADAKAIVAANPQVVAAWTAPGPAAMLLKALRAEGYTGLFAYGALSNPDFLSQLRAEERAGVIGTTSWLPTASDSASRRFTEAYQRTFGELPDSHAVAYYDAVYMIANAIRANGPAATAVQGNIIRLQRFAGTQGEYRPAVYNNGQLSATVLIVESGIDGMLREISRWENGVCIMLCY